MYQWLPITKNIVNTQAKRDTEETEGMSDTGGKDKQKQRRHLRLRHPAEIWNLIYLSLFLRRWPSYIMNGIKLTME